MARRWSFFPDAYKTLADRGRDFAIYDVKDTSTLYEDKAGTIPASVGSPVGRVEDVSGNGHHATQGTTADKPILREDSSGKKYLEFEQGESLNTGVTGDTVVLGYALPSIGGADLDYAPSSELLLEVTGAEYAVVSGDIPSVEKDALSDYMQGVATAYASGEVTTLRGHFRRQPLQRAGVDRWDTSEVTGMGLMFDETSVSDLSPLSDWDTSQVTGMDAMFRETPLSDLSPLSDWDTSQVTDMTAMFRETPLSDLSPLSDWDTSQVTDMKNMFRDTSVSDLSPLSDWDTSQVTDMKNMFRDTSVSDLSPISGWDVSQVTNFVFIFDNTSVSDLSPLSGWDVSKVTNMGGMFRDTSVSDLSPLSGWDVSKVTNMGGMFDGSLADSIPAGDMLAGWIDGSPNTASDLQSGVTIAIPNADYSQMNTAGQDAVDSLCSDPPNWTVNVTNAPSNCS